ncbi:3'-5' exonuclease [Pseudomonas sp. CFBP 13602]|uniref:3'-5' exonuclease n=1 Tax=Pseudomonas sp. CFBP 13602 TaxID=2774039 RepID=UPI00177D8DE4|nr:3'-5' exonuclease [Pseudomonas sp. CFBP 13602]MBD8826092.1 3'-5' exonuclease [Pseudomonas sp. CFBP 13602]
MSKEFYVSVDIEASGPIPGEFSMLSVGACVVGDPDKAIYIELKPDSPKHDPEALEVTGFDLELLAQTGLEPSEAMQQLAVWMGQVGAGAGKPVFVGLNAPFDWSFVNYYFHKYLGQNPFGFAALDIKAYYMGAFNLAWRETKSSHMATSLNPKRTATHNALDDARYQAELFELMLQRRVHLG